MERFTLSTEKRNTGKGFNRRARKNGWIPAVVYGKKRNAISVQVSERELEKATSTHAGFNTLFDLNLDGETVLARVREYQADLMTRNFVHVDFQAVDVHEKIDVEVPVEIIGKSAGVKEGGIVEQQRRSLHLRCLPTQIPDKIQIDITALNIGDRAHANQIALPEGVEFPHDTDLTVVAVAPPTKEEEVAPAVAAEGAVTAEGAAVATEEAAETAGKTPASPEKADKKEKK